MIGFMSFVFVVLVLCISSKCTISFAYLLCSSLMLSAYCCEEEEVQKQSSVNWNEFFFNWFQVMKSDFLKWISKDEEEKYSNSHCKSGCKILEVLNK